MKAKAALKLLGISSSFLSRFHSQCVEYYRFVKVSGVSAHGVLWDQCTDAPVVAILDGISNC